MSCDWFSNRLRVLLNIKTVLLMLEKRDDTNLEAIREASRRPVC